MNTLERLLGSKCRAAVLRRLVTGWQGTVSELARRTEFSVRSVAYEVRLLARESVVQVEVVGSSDVVRLRGSELTEALRRLVDATQTGAAAEDDRAQVKASLVALGAPLSGVEPVQHFSADETLVRALRLARNDGTVFRVLPLVLARVEEKLDWAALKERVRREKLKGELGVLVSLTAHLTGRPALAERVADLKDRRRTSMRYFPEAGSSFERELAKERTPPVAREWKFLMNCSEDTLRSMLTKHGA